MLNISGFNDDSKRIHFLDSMRVLAIFVVLIAHLFYKDMNIYVAQFSDIFLVRFFWSVLSSFFFSGTAGVVVFFIVSGYIISFVLESDKSHLFLIKRFFRIYPLYVFAVCVQALFLYRETGVFPNWSIFIRQVLLVGDFFSTPYALAGVEWTLRCEVVFYLFMALLMPFFRHYGLIATARRYILVVFFIFIQMLFVIFPPMPSGDNVFVGYFSIYFPFLFLGVVLFGYEKGGISLRLLLLYLIVFWVQYVYQVFVYWPTHSGSVAPFWGFMIFVLAWLGRAHFYSPKWLVFLADISFSLYLFHFFLWASIYSILSLYISIHWLRSLLSISIVFLFCTVVHYLVEKRGIALGRRYVKFISK